MENKSVGDIRDLANELLTACMYWFESTNTKEEKEERELQIVQIIQQLRNELIESTESEEELKNGKR